MGRDAAQEAKAPAERPVAVYRAYDIDGELLYVGASINPDLRMTNHRNTSDWWRLHSWFDVQWFPNSAQASAGEYLAITGERPRFNKAGVGIAYFPHTLPDSSRRPVVPATCRRFLCITEFAERTGLSVNTLKAYSQIPGRLPDPDAVTGRVKGWLPETIDAWIEARKRKD